MAGLLSAWILAAFAAAAFAAKKGRSPLGFFLLGLALPYLAIVLALIIDEDFQSRARTMAQVLDERVTSPRQPEPSRADEITKLAQLHRDGAIGDEEFQKLKRRVIEGAEASLRMTVCVTSPYDAARLAGRSKSVALGFCEEVGSPPATGNLLR